MKRLMKTFSSLTYEKTLMKNWWKTSSHTHYSPETIFILETSSSVTYWRWWFELHKRQRQLNWYFHYRRWYTTTELIKWLYLWYTSVTCKLRSSVDDNFFCAVYLSLLLDKYTQTNSILKILPKIFFFLPTFSIKGYFN